MTSLRWKYKLPFTLLADEDKQIVQDYGVWGEKSFMGRKYQGTHRVTFLIRAGRPHQKNLAEGEAGGTRGRSAGGVVKSDGCAEDPTAAMVNEIRPRRVSFYDTPSICAWIQ